MSNQNPSNPEYQSCLGCFAFQDIATGNYIDNQTLGPSATPSFFNVSVLTFNTDPLGNYNYLAFQSQYDGTWVTYTTDGLVLTLCLNGVASINDAALFLGPAANNLCQPALAETNGYQILNLENSTFLPVQIIPGGTTYVGCPVGSASTLQGMGMGTGNWGPYGTNGSYQNLSFDYLDLTNWAQDDWFCGKDFTGCSFQYTNMGTLLLYSSNFTNCNFNGATLIGGLPYHGTEMASINIGGATITNLDMRELGSFSNWIAGTGPQLTNFAGSVIDFTTFYNGSTYNIAFCDFSNATLINIPTDTGALVNLQAQGANITGIQLAGYDLTGANFQGATIAYANLNGANLTNANLSGAIATNANFNNAIMDQTNMTGIIAGGSEGNVGASFNFANMSNVTLNNANLAGANFSGAVLYGGSTSIANTISMENVNFSNSYLEGISFDNDNLLGCIFDGACLLNVDFSNSTLGATNGTGTSMVKACIQGANFSGTNLENLNMSGAAVSFTSGQLPIKSCGAELPPMQNYTPTIGLDATTIAGSTTCPNSYTYAQNVANNLTITQMLTAKNAPTSWSCAKIK
ncbi:MAG: pentapeptide repeat-containing protein [Taibaiella sp.]|nr:pentapeptide repeat-containing protein [Taibaiella sp.]